MGSIVDLAQQRLQVAGYGGLHYGAIATELKIARAAVHHYFPNKVDLARAVIDQYCQWTRAHRSHRRLTGRARGSAP